MIIRHEQKENSDNRGRRASITPSLHASSNAQAELVNAQARCYKLKSFFVAQQYEEHLELQRETKSKAVALSLLEASTLELQRVEAEVAALDAQYSDKMKSIDEQQRVDLCFAPALLLQPHIAALDGLNVDRIASVHHYIAQFIHEGVVSDTDKQRCLDIAQKAYEELHDAYCRLTAMVEKQRLDRISTHLEQFHLKHHELSTKNRAMQQLRSELERELTLTVSESMHIMNMAMVNHQAQR